MGIKSERVERFLKTFFSIKSQRIELQFRFWETKKFGFDPEIQNFEKQMEEKAGKTIFRNLLSQQAIEVFQFFENKIEALFFYFTVKKRFSKIDTGPVFLGGISHYFFFFNATRLERAFLTIFPTFLTVFNCCELRQSCFISWNHF